MLTDEDVEGIRRGIIYAVANVHSKCVLAQRAKPSTAESPYSRDIDCIRSESYASYDLYHDGLQAAGGAGVAANHALSTVLRTLKFYDTTGPTSRALYALARSALEGSSLAYYIHQPDIPYNSRILRCGQVLVWSARELITYSKEVRGKAGNEVSAKAKSDWSDLTRKLTASGISLAGKNTDKPWEKLQRLDDSVGKFEILNVFQRLGAGAGALYRILSAGTHHAPWFASQHIRIGGHDEGGINYGFDIPQSEQVSLIGSICKFMLQNASARLEYFGQSSTDLRDLRITFETTFNHLADFLDEMENTPGTVDK
ncbi:hypothetical protein ACTG9Q_20895 [Actinokineospora sp. 24-640]